jgi:hypothetical protein
MNDEDIPEPSSQPGPDETPAQDDGLRNEAVEMVRRIAGEVAILAEILTLSPKFGPIHRMDFTRVGSGSADRHVFWGWRGQRCSSLMSVADERSGGPLAGAEP